MAPADPTTTRRFKCWYTGPYGEHVMLFHAISGASVGDFYAGVQEIITLMSEMQYDGVSWDHAEIAAPGSNLFFPYTGWTTITADSVYSPAANDSPSAFLNFCGRSQTDGRRVKLYLFEMGLAPTNNMRLLSSENGGVAAVVIALNDETSVIGTITGSIPVWGEYANTGQNDYLTHKARQ